MQGVETPIIAGRWWAVGEMRVGDRVVEYKVPTKKELERIRRARRRPPMSRKEIEELRRKMRSGLPEGEDRIL